MRYLPRPAAPAVLIALAFATSLSAQPFAELKSGLVDYSKADRTPQRACDALAKAKWKEVVQIKAESVAAQGATPAFCRVTGTIAPEVAFEVALPAKWNGRLYMIGNGGHAGESIDDAGRLAQRNAALAVGFAFAQTNTGHDARKEPGASFVMSNPEKAIDYAYRAVHVTVLTAKAVTKDYYGKAVDKAYWNSCSNGGRQGLLEAERYPEDFDGVVANAPWVDQTGFTIGALWNQKALSAAPVSAAKMAMVAQKVMDKCDAIDGLKDGLIDDPRKCNFNPAIDAPACRAGTDSNDCLTPAQAEAIAKVYSGPMSKGKPFYPGYMPGSEGVSAGGFGGGPAASGWMNVIVAAQPGAKPADFNLAEGTMRYLVSKPPNPNYDYQVFNFDNDPPMLDAWSKLADAKNGDLTKFQKRGGKLIMTYGWADPILQPMAGVNFYEKTLAAKGPATTDSFRLFMIPGMSHCAGGYGPDQHDPVTAIVNWVEKGKAPDTMTASRSVAGKVVRTRPLCAYPKVAKFKGQGSVDDAANFACVAN